MKFRKMSQNFFNGFTSNDDFYSGFMFVTDHCTL